MKVGLVLAYRGVNYGMLLQAYATQRVIEKLGYETEIIEYTRTNYKHIYLTPYLLIYAVIEIIKKIRQMKKKDIVDDLHKMNIDVRKAVSNGFISKNLLNRKKCCGIIELEKQALTYNGVLVGSDQLWSPDAAFGNFTTLRFVPDNINKISYATSLGVSEYPFWCKSSAANFLKRINHVSVREEHGRKIINNFCNVLVKVVIDPTYLLTRSEWDELIPSEKLIDSDYILCYFLGATKEHKQLARAYADKHQKKLVTILSTESVSDIDASYADEVITGYGPEQFINLIRQAEVIMTDSFHGLAFSVINNKQFYVFYRTLVGSKGSRNSRIDNALNMWKLQDRLVLNESTVEDFTDKQINYDDINKLLTEKRRESLDYLTLALGDCK